jgi:HAD superfamily hydrolase (TIGR01484 family)
MYYAALATDYDGTLAHDGVVDAETFAALEQLKVGQRKLILVTGRELEDLQRVMPRLGLFDRVVAENGALLYRPVTREERPLGGAPPERFVQQLRAQNVQPLSVGRVIVATWEPNETVVLEAIRELGLELQIIFNKGAVMVLPAGVNKGSGLAAALADLKLSALDCVGVGDAENDNAFLAECGISVAVANALPALKETATWTTRGARGQGVGELIDRMLADDLAEFDAIAMHQRVELAAPLEGEQAEPLFLVPRRDTLLLAGASGSGKSTLTLGLLERLTAGGFQYCVIDPEGDYEGSLSGIGIGSSVAAPELDQVKEVLSEPDRSAIVNLLGIPTADRPSFFGALLPELLKLRAQTGRPHFVVVDEAHHLLPADWDPGGALLPNGLKGFLFVTVHPDRLSRRTLECVDRMLVIDTDPTVAASAFCVPRGLVCPPHGIRLEPGQVLTLSVQDHRARVMRVLPGTGSRRRHLRKYAEGRLGEDTSFYFRGPEGKLNIRAHNLMMFLQIAEGVDEDTWESHRRGGDYARWIETAIKDKALAEEVAAIERSDLSPFKASASARLSRAATRCRRDSVRLLLSLDRPLQEAAIGSLELGVRSYAVTSSTIHPRCSRPYSSVARTAMRCVPAASEAGRVACQM